LYDTLVLTYTLLSNLPGAVSSYVSWDCCYSGWSSSPCGYMAVVAVWQFRSCLEQKCSASVMLLRAVRSSVWLLLILAVCSTP